MILKIIISLKMSNINHSDSININNFNHHHFDFDTYYQKYHLK